MRTPQTLFEVVAMVASGVAVMASAIKYATARFAAQRREGKSVNDALADGAKPLTGSVWGDALLFVGVIASGVWVVLYYIRQ